MLMANELLMWLNNLEQAVCTFCILLPNNKSRGQTETHKNEQTFLCQMPGHSTNSGHWNMSHLINAIGAYDLYNSNLQLILLTNLPFLQNTFPCHSFLSGVTLSPVCAEDGLCPCNLSSFLTLVF